LRGGGGHTSGARRPKPTDAAGVVPRVVVDEAPAVATPATGDDGGAADGGDVGSARLA